MTIQDYAEIIGATVVVRRRTRRWVVSAGEDPEESRWYAELEGFEMLSEPRGFIDSHYGNGRSPEHAIAAMAKNLKGRTIRNTYSKGEYTVPEEVV